jgi:hypothetical protein
MLTHARTHAPVAARAEPHVEALLAHQVLLGAEELVEGRQRAVRQLRAGQGVQLGGVNLGAEATLDV